MEEIVAKLVIPWLLAHPVALSVLAWGLTIGTTISEVWTRIPAPWRAYVKRRWPRIAGAFDALVGYWPSLHKGNSALVHGVIRGQVKPERVTKEQLAEIVADAMRASRTPVPPAPPSLPEPSAGNAP